MGDEAPRPWQAFAARQDDGGTGLLGIGISILGVGLASYSLAVDFDSVEEGIRMGAPEKFSWLFAHGIIVSLVWLYIEILRLLARLRD